MIDRLWLIGAALLALSIGAGVIHNDGYRRGAAAEKAAIAEQTKRKLDDATRADDAHSRCMRDPACRLSDDGHRRD